MQIHGLPNRRHGLVVLMDSKLLGDFIDADPPHNGSVLGHVMHGPDDIPDQLGRIL